MKLDDPRVQKDDDGYFVFYKQKNRSNLQKFRKIKKICNECNDAFIAWSNRSIYCSRQCSGAYRSSIDKSHGFNTNTAKRLTGRDYVRELVRVRDGHRCQTCGKQKKPDGKRLDVHHLNGLCGKRTKKCDKVADMPGLITLCHKCHFAHHQFSTKSQFKSRLFNRGVLDK